MVRALAHPILFSAPVLHERGGRGQVPESQACVVRLHVAPPPQSASPRHWTQVADAPWSRHFGVPPPQGAQLAPHAPSDRHGRQVPDEHCEPAAQSPVTRHATHSVPAALQKLPAAVQSVHDGPQRASTLHGLQVPPLHQRPAAQSVSRLHARHAAPEHPKGQGTSRWPYWHEPPLHVPGESCTRRLLASAHAAAGGDVHATPMQGSPVQAPEEHPDGHGTTADE